MRPSSVAAIPIALVVLALVVVAGFYFFKAQTAEKAMNYADNYASGGTGATTQGESDSALEEGQPVTQPQLSQPQPSTNTTMKQYAQAPSMQIDRTKKYEAILHTDQGDITIALAADKTPTTVNNFVFLARDHFYDATIFHRVIKGFMIQGGDPQGTGAGGPGYRFADEKFDGTYSRGTVAMANAGANTNGSQFFIMHAVYPLPPNYVIFGHVTSGMEAVDAIASAPTNPGGEGSTPTTPVRIKSVDIKEL